MSGATLKLSKPIQAHGKEVTEITLREPNGEDVIDVGFPYIIAMSDGEPSGIELKPKALYGYISRLGGIPLSSAKQLALKDVTALQGEIMAFFGEGSAGT